MVGECNVDETRGRNETCALKPIISNAGQFCSLMGISHAHLLQSIVKTKIKINEKKKGSKSESDMGRILICNA